MSLDGKFMWWPTNQADQRFKQSGAFHHAKANPVSPLPWYLDHAAVYACRNRAPYEGVRSTKDSWILDQAARINHTQRWLVNRTGHAQGSRAQNTLVVGSAVLGFAQYNVTTQEESIRVRGRKKSVNILGPR